MVIGKSYLKIIFREIKKSFGRFAAIIGIVTLGVGFLVGILSSTPDMQISADKYYDENQMTDIFIKATMGLTEDDLKTVAALSGVEKITPAYVTDAVIQTSQEEMLTARIYGLPLEDNETNQMVNHLTLTEGRMPQQPSECVVQRAIGNWSAPPVGSEIQLIQEDSDEDDLTERFSTLKYTVVGIVENPFYFSSEKERSSVGSGRTDTILYIPRECYLLEVYTDFYLTLSDAITMNTFGDDYEALVNNYVEQLEQIADKRSVIRFEEVYSEAEEKLTDAQQELADAQKEIEQELTDAWHDLENARNELDDGWQELLNGRQELEDEIADALLKIVDSEKELADAAADLEKGEQELLEGEAELRDGEKQYKEGAATLRDGERQYDEGVKEYEAGIAQFAAAWSQLEAGQKALEETRLALEQGEKEYADGAKQLQENENLLKQGEQEMESRVVAMMSELGFSVSDINEALDILEDSSATASLKQEIDNKRQEAQAQIDELKRTEKKLQQQIEVETDPDNLKLLQTQLQEIQVSIEQAEGALSQLPTGDQVVAETANTLRTEKNKMEESKAAIEKGKQQLTANRQKLDDGWKAYNEGKAGMDAAIAQYNVGKTEMDAAAAQLQISKAELADGWAELNSAKAGIDEGWAELENAKKELKKGRQEYEDGLKALTDAKTSLAEKTAEAKQELADAEIELNDAELEYTDGLLKYEDGKAEAEEELADARRKLADARQKLAELETPKWYILDRSSNVTFAGYKINVQKVADIAKVFPVFFFLVSALVTLTTMTRMVEEERTQIGTLKALGYRELDILLKYLVYCGLATAIGCIMGVLIGFRLIPIALNNAYISMYNLPPLITRFEWPYVLASCLTEAACTLFATYSVCHQSMKEKPALLMLPQAPKAGQRIFLERFHYLWKHLSFSYKATIRNIFRYKKHLIMTVLGIGGCTALMLTGFGLEDSVSTIANTQFESIWKFDLRIDISDEEPDTVLSEFLKQYPYMPVYSESGVLRSENGEHEATVYVPQNAGQLENFVLLHDRKTDTPLFFDENGVLLAEKLADELGLSVGDIFELENGDGDRADFTVTGITENYAGGYAYIGPEVYRRQFSEAIPNLLLVKSEISLEKQTQTAELLLTSDQVSNVEFHSQTKASYDNLLQSLGYIVLLLIIAAGALAVIVLYNLTNININERMRELATLRVLGYYHKEVAAYIFREITILSILGAVFGLFVGFGLHRYVIVRAETVEIMFGRTIEASSFLWSGILTLLFSALVNLLMLPKLRKLDMTESMKAVD